MKTYLKVISLVLALVMLFSSLVACDSREVETNGAENTNTEAATGNEGNESAEETASETETDYFPDVARKNYDDSFFLAIHNDSNPMVYYWVEESSNDAMSQAIYDRQMKVKDYLGVEILATKTETGSKYVDPFKTAVKNKDGSIDALLTHVYHGIDGFVTENYLANFKDIPGLNLEADYWNYDLMDSISLHDRMYLGFGDFNILYTHVIAFNKDLMSKYEDALEESVYDMVDNYHWTLDRMISLANMVYVDTTADGKTIDDTFGIIGVHDIAFCGFLHSSNINIIELNEKGEYALSVYNDINKAKTTDIVEKIGALVKSNGAWFWKMNAADRALQFHKGTALMSLSSTNSLPGYLNYDLNFGVLPYPIYNEDQKDVGYRSLKWGGYIAVPSYVRNINLTGDTLEMLSFYSAEVNNTFYNKLLGKQVADSPVDKRMLEIVWDGLCSDFCQTYYSCMISTQVLYVVPYLTFEDATKNLSSFIAGAEKTVSKSLKKLMTLSANLQ